MLCPYCNRHKMYLGEDGKLRCPFCHDVVQPKTGLIRNTLPEFIKKVYAALESE